MIKADESRRRGRGNMGLRHLVVELVWQGAYGDEEVVTQLEDQPELHSDHQRFFGSYCDRSDLRFTVMPVNWHSGVDILRFKSHLNFAPRRLQRHHT